MPTNPSRLTAPTRPELEAVTETLFNTVIQSFTYYIWWTRFREVMNNSGFSETHIRLQRNAAIESTLLSIRKLNDFFRARPPKPNERIDDVFAYDFPGFNNSGGFLEKADFDELHKRIGHITLREHRHGRVTWDIHQATVTAAERYLVFTDFLRNTFFVGDALKAEKATMEKHSVQGLIDEMAAAKLMDHQGNLSK